MLIVLDCGSHTFGGRTSNGVYKMVLLEDDDICVFFDTDGPKKGFNVFRQCDQVNVSFVGGKTIL